MTGLTTSGCKFHVKSRSNFLPSRASNFLHFFSIASPTDTSPRNCWPSVRVDDGHQTFRRIGNLFDVDRFHFGDVCLRSVCGRHSADDFRYKNFDLVVDVVKIQFLLRQPNGRSVAVFAVEGSTIAAISLRRNRSGWRLLKSISWKSFLSFP